ncbi:tripartite motif-containing protein 55-like [Saccostrea cucullata]|uniref:tripartite motif-containing protein 55-like n=1 Tax=Saccostrea cuccullata TaxID=36930 RepID=UPI002ED277ED
MDSHSSSEDDTEVKLESTPLYPGCVSHAKERCEMFCKNCDTPICHTCLASDEHLGHKYSKILDILDEKKDLLKKRQIELKETICPTYQEIAVGEQNRIRKMEKEYGDLSTGLAIHEDYLHKEIDKLFNKLKAKTSEMKNKQLHTLQKHLEDINKTLIEIDDEIDGIDKALRSNDISTILQVLHSSKIDQHKKLPNKLVPSAPKFTPGKIQEEKLLKFVGVLSQFNITIEKHGYSIHVKAAQEPLEFGYLSQIKSNSTEISSPNVVSLKSQEEGSSPQVSKKLSPGPGSSPQVAKKSPGAGFSPQVAKKSPGAGSSPQVRKKSSGTGYSPEVPKKFPADEYPPADEQQSPDYGSTTM